MTYELSFLFSLILTLIVEIPIVFLMVRYINKAIDKLNIILSGALASTLTLPYFWFVMPAYVSNRMLYIVIGESLIILIEALIYYRLLKLKFTQALLVSFIANLASVIVGYLIGF